MDQHSTTRLSLVLVFVAMSVLGLRASAVQIEGAEGVAPSATYHARAEVRRVALSPSNVVATGQVVTQTFTLHAGWNTIYLEVEPTNSSPLVGVGLLFSAGWSAELEDDLDAGTLPDALRQAFENNGITLSDRISVTKPEDTYWLIADDAELVSYAVFKEDENGGAVLNVYSAALHELSTLEAVFDTLACNDCLESVWTWNVPVSKMDYVIDPAEGLWDEPGWKRYFPETSVGPDGVSREFLTDLLSLHANTGYLVKLKDDAANVDLTVSGTPVAGNHVWLKGSYNLAGFPIDPDAAPAPTVGAFFQNLQAGPSPITEVRVLGSDGRWGSPLAASDGLNHGQAYLVYYDDEDPDAPDDYTAPLNIVDVIQDGLQFLPGYAGRRQTVRIENLSSAEATVTVSLVEGADAEVALRYEDSSTDPVTSVELKANAVQITLSPGDAEDLEFDVQSAEQAGDGEALLALSSADLGTRWLVPVSAEAGSLAGLWIGDVIVNDVSQARLGATDVEGGALTIELRQRDESGIRGAAELTEKPSGNTASVAMTVTLALPAPELIVPEIISGTAPYVGGYVFEDANENGQRDAFEKGFEGAGVTLETFGGGTVLNVETDEDGSYLFEGLDPDSYTLALDQQPPSGYTADFDVTPPAGETDAEEPPPEPNTWPVEVTVDEDGVTRIAYSDGTADEDFPRYDATDERVEPELNFGYVTTYDASLWTGACADRLEKRRDLDPVVNGLLETELNSAALNQGYDVDDQLLGGSSQYVIYVEEQGGAGEAGQGVACGEIVVGAPTRFEDGQGSDFTFRLLLRVDEAGHTELLPYYEVEDGPRVSSAAFSIQEPLVAGGVDFGDTSGLLDFSITIDPQDPLNPFEHKYHPDHDNLDAKFNEIDFDAVDPYLWEAPEIRRRIKLELTELPPYSGADVEELAAQVDWGGATWGGLYKEVIKGIHKNDITVKGYFVIRHALTAEELESQSYD